LKSNCSINLQGETLIFSRINDNIKISINCNSKTIYNDSDISITCYFDDKISDGESGYFNLTYDNYVISEKIFLSKAIEDAYFKISIPKELKEGNNIINITSEDFFLENLTNYSLSTSEYDFENEQILSINNTNIDSENNLNSIIYLTVNLNKNNPKYLFRIFRKSTEYDEAYNIQNYTIFESTILEVNILSLQFSFDKVYIFDDAKPIEVDVGKDVRMVREENDEDLIGICNINLKNLILVGKIQGKFEIRNNERKVGNLIIDMSCEEINRYDQKTININYTIKKDGVDPLLIKLAAFLRNKGLNMKSAFKLFDTNNENSISLDSFRSVISSIKFTDSNDEITKLMQIIFESKARIYQDDFTRIFDGLLPYDDNDMDFYNKNSKSHFYQNNMIDSKNMEFSINRQYEKLNKTGVIQSINTQDNINNLRGGNLKGDNFNSGKFDKNNQSNINRNIRDIMKQVNDYMIGFGAYNAIDLYKMFDYDGNTLVGKKEMADGFGNLGIRLSNDELEMIWYEIVENDQQIEYFDFRQFKKFYNKHRYIPDK
jgi:Ca2+-binding EF-hand superfamily protein